MQSQIPPYVPIIISICALLLALASFIFSIRNRRHDSRLQKEQAITDLLLTLTQKGIKNRQLLATLKTELRKSLQKPDQEEHIAILQESIKLREDMDVENEEMYRNITEYARYWPTENIEELKGLLSLAILHTDENKEVIEHAIGSWAAKIEAEGKLREVKGTLAQLQAQTKQLDADKQAR